MALSDQVERFSRAPIKHKILGLVLITLFFGAVFYFMFYSDIEDKLDNLAATITTLEGEISNYEDKKQKYMAFRAEVNKLLEEQKELIKVLPVDAKVAEFLQSLHAQSELAGLSILTFQPGGEARKGFYAQIPVKMALSGSFHEITKFFYSVGQLKRIVNIQDVVLSNPEVRDTGVALRASFLASTFRFISPGGGNQ